MLSERQEKILQIVKENSPITGQHIANRLHVTRAALRSDLAILTMLGLIDARPKLGYFFTGNKEKDLLSRAITDHYHLDSLACLSRSSSASIRALMTLLSPCLQKMWGRCSSGPTISWPASYRERIC